MTLLERADATKHALEVLPVTGRIGAEVRGADLAATDDQTIADLRLALLAHKVLFFRQQRLDEAGQLAFAARFGPLTLAHPTIESVESSPQLFELDSTDGGRANYWHTDVTFTDRPPTASVLRAVTLPSFGGDTIWANTVSAYEALPTPLRHLADQLRAVHTNAYDYARRRKYEADGEQKREAQFVAEIFETEHPVVRIHPETGDRSILLGGFARHLVGLSSLESADLIRTIQQHVTSPEHTVRWRWQPGDVAMWDNRATQHYAVNDYGDAHRVMNRVTIAGARPIGIDGRTSTALVGDASTYSPLAP